MFKYINPKNLQKEIEFYGYQYSLYKHIMITFVVIAVQIGLAYILGLTRYQISLLIFIILCILPRLVLNMYINMFEQKKFMELSSYMEQMLYSFKRKSKILTALEDTKTLFPEGLMGDRIGKALHYIEYSYSEGDIYKEALEIIEEEYDCDILCRIHDFMMNVEKTGGNYEMSLDILITDRNKWVSRIALARKEIQVIKRNVTIAILLSLLIITGTVLMVPTEFVDIKTNVVSQISSMVTIIVNLALWTYVQCKFSKSWLRMDARIREKEIEKYYIRITSPSSERRVHRIVKILVIAGICCYIGYTTQNMICLCICVCFGIILLTQHQRSYKTYKNRLRREVEKVFPDWLLGLSLSMQTENVQVAINQSIEKAPLVLRQELIVLGEKLEKHPTAIMPYLEFYRTLEIPDVQSAMRMLYSMGQNGTEEMARQIQTLIQRNTELQDHSEKLKVADYLSGMGFCVVMPMLFGCGKMMADMMVLMLGILTTAQGFY